MKKVVIALFILVVFAGSVVAEPHPLPANLKGIVRVFMHQPREYSFLVLDEKGIARVLDYRRALWAGEVEFVFDVSDENPMWMESNLKYSSLTGYSLTWVKIHLRTQDDINGAGWTRRVGKKTTHGTTVVVR